VSRARRRYYRTILLGVAAMATLLWAAVDQFGIPWQDMLQMFLWVLAGVALIILCAAFAVATWIGLKSLLGRRR
jgi:peptidoglycan biosynthesis protein MviN/MurJ (putative lipid II flippase)